MNIKPLQILVASLSILASHCGADTNVEFSLINPCTSDILYGEGCQFIRLFVHSLNTQDQLYPGNDPGPWKKDCPKNLTSLRYYSFSSEGWTRFRGKDH